MNKEKKILYSLRQMVAIPLLGGDKGVGIPLLGGDAEGRGGSFPSGKESIKSKYLK